MIRSTVFAVIAAAVTIAAAVGQGRFVHRWGTPPALGPVVAALDAFPRTLGPWRAVADGEPLGAEVCRELGVAGYLTRVYRHEETNATARLIVLVGLPGRLVRHPPTVCYANQNNIQVGEVERRRVDGGEPPGEFFVAHYERGGSAAHERFAVAFAHSDNGLWEASDSPRLRFGGAPLLFKMQVLVPVEAEDDAVGGLFAEEGFARHFSEGFRALYRDAIEPAAVAQR